MKRLVLIGGGHAHLEVLRQAAARPFAGAEVLLVSPFAHHYYSGMVPGFLQGTYAQRDLAFDLPALCRAAGVRFREAFADRVDPAGQWVEVDGTRLECDVISADVGSAPAGIHDVPGAREHAYTVRPMTRAVALDARLAEATGAAGRGARVAVCVVGGGAAGIEVSLAVHRRLASAGITPAVTLVDRSPRLLGDYAPRVRRVVEELFASRNIHARTGREVVRVTPDAVVLDTDEMIASALTIWLTGAVPAALTAASALPKDDHGFWLVDQHLRSVACEAVWGAGDCVAIEGHPWVSKAGVYAVRQGPVLAANLRLAAESPRAIPAERLARYEPQRHFLALLNTADDRALLRWHGITAHTRWAWWLKDAIDRRFMARYEVAEPWATTPARPVDVPRDAPAEIADDEWITTTAALQAAVEADAVTVIDVRSGSDYRQGHVPGAVRVSWLDYRNGWARTGKLPDDLDRVARSMAALGVDSTRAVVVYGNARDGWGEEGRIAWMLHYLGHPRVSVLDGGWRAWQRSGAPISTDAVSPRAGRFQARPRPAFRASADDVASAPAQGIAILDTRSEGEWNGSRKYWPRRTGRIPGAVHLEWRDLLTSEGFLDRSAALRERLRALGLTPERTVIAYCVGGVRSGEAFMLLKALGYRDVRNYDGSWYEWAADERRPIVPGR